MSVKNKFINFLKNPIWDVWLFIIAVVLLNLVAQRAFIRWDLTKARSYSLSSASKRVVKNLEEPLSVKVFFSSNLPAPYSSVYQYVQDILSEYKTVGNKNFNYELYDMERAENQTMARNYGLNQAQIQEVKNNEVGLKSVFMGMALTYSDQIQVIDGITVSDGLEYKITNAISSLISNTNALSGLKSKVNVTLYSSEAFSRFGIMGFDKVKDEVNSAFEKANKKFQGRLSYNVQNPNTEEAQALGKRYGIQTISWKERSGEEEEGALGLVIEYEDSFRTVPLQVVSGFFGYEVDGLDSLQDSIEKSVLSLVSNTSIVAYITGHGELDSSDAQKGCANFAGLLSSRYTLQNVDLEKEDIPVGVQTVMINGPKEAFSEAELYKIDQFLLKGGSLILFLDPFDVQEDTSGQSYFSMPEYIPIKTGLEDMLLKYGIECKPSYVLDENCYVHQAQQYGTTRILNYYYLPRIMQKSINQKHPITQNLGYLYFYQPGVLDVSGAKSNKDLNTSVLVSTSDKSWTMSENIMLSPLMSVPDDRSTEKSEDVAVIVEGLFTSAFDAPKKESQSNESGNSENVLDVNNQHLEKSTQKGRIFVASTSYITTAALIDEEGSQPIAYFLQNAVDYMNGNEELCPMRTKGLSLSGLHTTQGAIVLLTQYFNEFGLAFIVAIIGLVVIFLRRRRRTLIRMQYNPNSTRELK